MDTVFYIIIIIGVCVILILFEFELKTSPYIRQTKTGGMFQISSQLYHRSNKILHWSVRFKTVGKCEKFIHFNFNLKHDQHIF